ncbi:MAG: DUF4244 domain-containing protein [Arsenicicoccus sp.]|uniref:DUF4244 domain-containing protein n=1 Tax=Serinicoccus profundi TaxID=1078471 RepID=UPI000255E44F|nr:DUF4244 domain-containing protein [Serinicoccus profundi]PZU49230.1 MAG: DUF4244 domain-containing protein [Arsenicicoccus sp.]
MKKKNTTIGAALRRLRERGDAGMTTAEYAVGTIAACAFAAVLMAILQSGGVKGVVTSVITTALSVSL